MFRIKLLKAAFVMVLAVVLASCTGPNTERMADVNPVLWEAGSTVRIEASNNDTVGLRRLSIPLMFNDNFDRRPMHFAVTVIAPDSTRITEEIVIQTFHSAIKHGDNYLLNYPYRDSVRFGHKGSYCFEISPIRNVIGVKSIGIDIVSVLNGQE